MLEMMQWVHCLNGGHVMRGRDRRQKGFTLIEALVVVGIIGVIVAVSIPSMRRSRMRASMHSFACATTPAGTRVIGF